MYQSLHTTVIGPYRERMEIQIRTEEMDKIASEGIAAHWLYKEGKVISKDEARQFDWLRRLTEWQKELEDPREFLESVRMDLFPDEVYVLTPNGEIKEFPSGATPIDFAYAIHTEVGHHCAGTKVNGKMVPLKYQLQNGDVVQIITSKHHVPSRDWLKIAKTSKARARIRQWIKTEEREKSLALGKELCAREFKKHRLNFNEFLKSESEAKEISGGLSFKSVDDMLIATGYGKISPVQIAKKYLKIKHGEDFEFQETELQTQTKVKKPSKEGILIHGHDDIMIHLGECCTPVPGDEVVGYITRGRGVTIHRETCPNVDALEPERKVEVTWITDNNVNYPVKLNVITADQKGMLAAVSNAISVAEANILEAKVTTNLDQSAHFTFVAEVRNGKHLKRVISGIKKVGGVMRVARQTSS